jgi:hypothetical protein
MTKRTVVNPLKFEKPPHKVSDKSARLWESYYGPMNGAVQGLNAAIQNMQNILGRIIIAQEGMDPDTYLFDADRMMIIRKPTPAALGENGNG